MPAGRPSLYDPAICPQVRDWCAAGATDLELADKLGIHVATVHAWKHTHPEFSDAIKEGKQEVDTKVERSLFHRAMGYSHPAVKILTVNGQVEEVPYTEHYPPDTTAAIFWLKNRRPAEWRDLKHTELTGANGGAVKVEHGPDLSRLTKDELRAMDALLAKASATDEPTEP